MTSRAKAESAPANGGEQPDLSFSALPQLPTPALAQLPAPAGLPPHLARPLSRLELRLAHRLASGDSWQEACTACRVKPKATIRSYVPKRQIAEAAQWLISDCANRAGLSREWVRANCVALYARACQADQVFDKSGKPTGIWRFDGATAARLLQMLGEDIGMFGKGKGQQLGVDQVAALLEAVAARGKRQLAPAGRLVGESSAVVPRGTDAQQQGAKAPENQGAIPADSSVMSQDTRAST